MINFENCILKVLKFFNKTNGNNKTLIEILVNKIWHLEPRNKQLKNPDEFKYESDTRTSDVKEIEIETKSDDDDDNGGLNDNDDNNDYDGDVEIEENAVCIH